MTYVTSPPASQPIRTPRRLSAGVGFALVTIFLAGVNLAWFERHNVPPNWDESNYHQTTEELYQSVLSGDGAAFRQAYVSAVFGSKAPLIAFVPLPGYLLFGDSREVWNLSMVALVVLFCWTCYRMGIALTGDSWLAVVAVWITGTIPVVYGLSRVFLVEYGLTVLVTVWIWLQIRSDHFRRLGFNVGLGVVFGLGTLMKVTFPVLIAIPVAWGLANRLMEPENRWRTVRQVALAALVIGATGSAFITTWYLPNSNYLTTIQHALDAATSEYYAYGEVGSWSTVLRWARDILVIGLSLFYGMVLFALIVIAAGVRLFARRAESVGVRPWRVGPGWLLAAWPAVIIGVSFAAVVKDSRYFLPVFPAIGAGMAMLVFWIFRRGVTRVAAVVAILGPASTIFLLNSLPLKDDVVLGPIEWRVYGPSWGHVMRPLTQVWPHEEMIRAIAGDAEAYFDSREAFVLLVADAAYYNQHNFRYYATRLGLKSRLDWSAVLTSRDQTEQRWREISDWMIQAKYLITKTGDNGPGFSAYRNDDIRRMLEAGVLPYVRWREFGLPDGSEGVIYRRRRGNVSLVDLSKVVLRRGAIVSWEADLRASDTLKLKVWREHQSGFVAVAESDAISAERGKHRFALSRPLPVQPGDYVGLYTAGEGVEVIPPGVVRRQFVFDGDVACGLATRGSLRAEQLSFRVQFDDRAVTPVTPVKVRSVGKGSPLTFVDLSKQLVRSGSLVGWATNTSASDMVRLKVWRKKDDVWTVAGESRREEPVVGFNQFTLNPPIAVEPGDYLGVYADWHGEGAKGAALPFPVRGGGCPVPDTGSLYVPGDFRGTIEGAKLVPDVKNFQVFGFYGAE